MKKTVILLGCRDHRELLRFPSDGGEFHGYTIDIEDGDDQLAAILRHIKEEFRLGSSDLIKLHTVIAEGLVALDGEGRQLAICELAPEALRAPEEWLTLPLILRGMGKGRGRLVYNKAMQVYAGANLDDIAALEIDDEVRERLRQLEKDGKI